MSQSFEASGFAPSGESKAFVALGPKFVGKALQGNTKAHVDVHYFMSPSEARQLAADLIRAADVAEPIADMARTLTADSLEIDGAKVPL